MAELSGELHHLLNAARMVLDGIANGRSVSGAEAERLAQRIVDVIGHDVTDEQPAHTVTVPAAWRSHDDDSFALHLRLNSDGSITWFSSVEVDR